jgi:hypothetical protein
MDQDVVGLDVTMDDVESVEMKESRRNLVGKVEFLP